MFNWNKKAPSASKTDVYINKSGYSIKASRYSRASIINTTTRPGFERVCDRIGSTIEELDDIIEEYWTKRENGVIGEDTKIIDVAFPFSPHREYLRPILEYFMFDGTGKGDSKKPADFILEYQEPWDYRRYNKLDRKTAFDRVWESLVFSMRDKGLPNIDWHNCKNYKEKSIMKWVRYVENKHKGALHVRY